MRTPLALVTLAALSLSLAQAQPSTPATRHAAPPDIRGDGTTDDTAAIQRAIDAGGAVRLPRGIYRLTATVVIDLDRSGFTAIAGDGVARFAMEGEGPAFRLVGTHAGTAAPGTVRPEIWERQRTPMIDGIEIVGANPAADGIELAGTIQPTITRVTVREARHGIHLTGRNRNVLIADCHIYHNRGAGVFYDQVDLHQSNVVGCHISYNAGGGIVTVGGGVRNLHVGTCDIESNMTPESPATANVLVDCTGGSTAEVSIVGCTIQHNPAPGSANVRFVGRGKPGGPDDDTRWGHLTIANNVLTDVEVNIDLLHARGVSISGNTFGGGYSRDLCAIGCSDVAVTGNTFDRNPPYYRGPAAAARGGLLFRDSRDVTLTGLHINGAREQPAAILLENCDTFNVSGCTILDSDGHGLLLSNTRHSLVTGCLIADRRAGRSTPPGIAIDGGEDNAITGNKLAPGAGGNRKNVPALIDR